jgi:hypothetical protein
LLDNAPRAVGREDLEDLFRDALAPPRGGGG